MKIIPVAIAFISLLLGCNNGSSVKYLMGQGYDKWGETNVIQDSWKAYKQGDDTLVYFTNFYSDGKLKSSVIMKNDGLHQILFVLDTLGNKKYFGRFKNGNGCVIQFSSEDGTPESRGCYVDGNREGWWGDYDYNGHIRYSTFYKNGFAQRQKNEQDDALTKLMDNVFGVLKNNLYN